MEIQKFAKDLTHIFVCENPLNFSLLQYAKFHNIKLYIQTNYEFCDHLNNKLPLPHKFVMPSTWMVDDMKQRFGDDVVTILPPPVDVSEFAEAFNVNIDRTKENRGTPRLLHMVGTLASKDRNGTLDVLKTLPYITEDLELVIHSQHELPNEYIVEDDRVTYSIGTIEDPADMYKGFEAMVLPRRYGGLCLPMWEAMLSGLPVIMTGISPNADYIDKQWLVPAKKTDTVKARVPIDVYSSDIRVLANRMKKAINRTQDDAALAFATAVNTVSFQALENEYKKLW